MANRSYLYGYKAGETPEHRDLSEWKTNVPLLHLLLVGVDVEPVPTAIWSVEEKIALSGDAPGGLDLFTRFLEWLAPRMGAQAEEFARYRAEALELLGRREDERYHLELGEIFELSGYELDEMEAQTRGFAGQAAGIVTEAERLMSEPGAELADSTDWLLREAADMNGSLGLYFPGILYFHLG